MPNIYVQPAALTKCPHCGASNRPKSKNFRPLVAPAIFGVYFHGRWTRAFHACYLCFAKACQTFLMPSGNNFLPRSGYSLPTWVKPS
jgi:hypothetical protein